MPVLMKRGNGERFVPDEKMTEYLEMGYSVIDERGNIIQKPEPTTPDEFKKEMNSLRQKIAELEAECATLKAQELADGGSSDEECCVKSSQSAYKGDETERSTNNTTGNKTRKRGICE